MRDFGIPAFQLSVALFLAICAQKIPQLQFWPAILLALAACVAMFGGIVTFGKALRSGSDKP
jgi:hypothetical protein